MNTPPLRILLVDDEPANLILLKKVLARQQHICTSAASGEEAVALFGSQNFDLVLLDVMLPGINGFETVSRLRQLREQWFPVIFLSALGEPIDIVTALDAGGDDYMSKPVDIDILNAKIGALYRVASRQQLAQEQTVQLRRYFDLVEREKALTLRLFSRLRRDQYLAGSRADVASLGADGPSGDLMALQESPDGRVQLIIADAMGHGLLAAAQLFPLIELFHDLSVRGYVMPTIIARASLLLQEIIPDGNFICACFVTLDLHGKVAEVWNLGMPDALLLEADGAVTHRFGSRFVPLGIEPVLAEALEPERVAIKPKQHLLMYSDGILEARRADGERFGRTRFEDLLGEVVERGSECALTSMHAFLDGRAANDDVTVCRYTVSADSWLFLRDRPVADYPRGALVPAGARLSLRLGPSELARPDPVADVLGVLRNVADIEARCFGRLFLVVWQLMRNAIDWGVLGLAPEHTPIEREAERWGRLRDLPHGFVDVELVRQSDATGAIWWLVCIADSGQGFDVDAWTRRKLNPAYDPAQSHWGGLDIIQGLCGGIEFEQGGSQVRVRVPG